MAEIGNECISIDSEASSDSDCEIVSCSQSESKWAQENIAIRRLNILLNNGFTNIDRLLELLFEIDTEDMPPSSFEKLQMLLSLLSTRSPRSRLNFIQNINSVVKLIESSKRILILTGAGISVSCGIPDFRSKDGIYSRLAVDYPDLKSPQSMFDIDYFEQNPKPFFNFAKEICPGQFSPSIAHRFIAYLESQDKLLRNYTQNIDTLEQEAGISKIIQCHGSFNSATCLTCWKKYSFDDIREDLMNRRISKCSDCLGKDPKELVAQFDNQSPTSIMTKKKLRILNPESQAFAVIKPDIVFFGEDLPEVFHETLMTDIHSADLVIVMGSSLKVRPVASIPSSVDTHVPQILINREQLPQNSFDIELLGDCDVILSHIASKIGWTFPQMTTSHGKELPEFKPESLTEIRYSQVQSEIQKKMGISKNCEEEKKPKDSPIVDDEPKELSENKSENEPVQSLQAEQEVTEKDVQSKEDKKSDEEDDEILVESDDSSDLSQTFSVSEYLPKNSFCLVNPGTYVFPGAEHDWWLLSQSELDDLDKIYDSRDDPINIPSEEERKSSCDTLEQIENRFMEKLLLKCANDNAFQNNKSYKESSQLPSSDNASSSPQLPFIPNTNGNDDSVVLLDDDEEDCSPNQKVIASPDPTLTLDNNLVNNNNINEEDNCSDKKKPKISPLRTD